VEAIPNPIAQDRRSPLDDSAIVYGLYRFTGDLMMADHFH